MSAPLDNQDELQADRAFNRTIAPELTDIARFARENGLAVEHVEVRGWELGRKTQTRPLGTNIYHVKVAVVTSSVDLGRRLIFAPGICATCLLPSPLARRTGEQGTP